MRIYFGQMEESLEDPLLVRGRDWRAKACSKHAVSRDLSVCGTYVHGLFDDAGLRRAWVDSLRAVKGMAPGPSEPVAGPVDRLADMLGRGKEPPSHKYLAEQRIAYAFIGVNILVVVASGVVKDVKNLPGVLGHFAAFAIKANRKLLPAMIDGTVDREYAEERHGLWYEEVSATDRTHHVHAEFTPRRDDTGERSRAS